MNEKRNFSLRLSSLCCAALLLGLLTFSESSAETCLTSDCHADLSGLTYRHSPAGEGECSACHEPVKEEHPAVEGESFRLAESGAKLCYRCHESMGRKLNAHSPVEEGECTACHNPHGSNAGPLLLEVGHDLTELCADCHDPSLSSQKFAHGPAASGACTACHDPHESNNPSLLKKPLKEACNSCHVDMAEGLADSPVVHTAVKDSACTACHDPHSAPAPNLLQKEVEDLCMECHEDVGKKAKKARTKHAALYRQEKCSACHSTHFSEYPSLLPASEKEVCLSCHSVDDYTKSDPLKNIAKEIEGKKNLHGPLVEGECTACHSPHGSDAPRLLVGSYPSGFYEPFRKGGYDFCLQCHDESMLRFRETSIYTEFRNGKQNLHFLHVSDKYKGRTCRACHEPHASDMVKMISEEGAEFGEWRIPTRFVPTETGGSCSPGCHQTYEYDREKPVRYEE